ncbi:MAG TPA: hypothetical protein VE871_18425 [Longimicrobium sp.]|nr:hypothetical protein [Longimicrobium sp.]
MPTTRLESPLDPPRLYASPPTDGEPIGRGVRIMAAVLGSPMVVVGAAGGMMAVWALAEGRWEDAREHAASIPALLCGLLLLASAHGGTDVVRKGVDAVLRGVRHQD